MNIFTKQIWTNEEYKYDTKTDFIPTITGYVHGTKTQKPTVLVVPGGGYSNVSPAEAEVVAFKFLAQGYNAFILTYSTRTALEQEPVGHQALKDIAKAMVVLNENAGEWNIDIDKIFTIGFSAGGHLVASLGVHHNKPILDGVRGQWNIKPKAQILCYPVITTTESYAHMGSKTCLLGSEPSDEEVLFMSVEKQVSDQTPTTFLWHCVDDASVSYENSIAFANNLGKCGVQFDLHIFPYGAHGVSTVDDAWVAMSYDVNLPVYELMRKLMKRKIEKNDINFTNEVINNLGVKTLEEFLEIQTKERNFKDISTKEYKHISKWVELAIEWLSIELYK